MHFRRTGALTFPDVGRDELVGPRFNAIAICGEPTMTAEYTSHTRDIMSVSSINVLWDESEGRYQVRSSGG